MNRHALCLSVLIALVLTIGRTANTKPPETRTGAGDAPRSIDNTTYINANNILMFVTNHGGFGGDFTGQFGQIYNYGTYYPYTGIDDILNGVNDRSVLYQAGLWIGGIDSASGDTLVTVSQYASEYAPGPMSGGTFQPDRPEFRLYKLYSDSLAGNPNQDYLNWPVDQGAPVDGDGRPEMRGDQMLWTVFNDADSSRHLVYPGRTAPLGIEVQQTVWAVRQSGDIDLPAPRRLLVTGPADSTFEVKVYIIDHASLSGHDYTVVTDTSAVYGFVWHLIDVTTGDTLLANQTNFLGSSTAVTDGLRVTVTRSYSFTSFEVVANSGGPIDPPLSGALASAGFPTPGDEDPGGDQQVGPGRWAIHTGDNGGSSGGGTRGSYDAFLTRVFRSDVGRMLRLAGYDWEMRFTGSNDNPGVGGSYAWDGILTARACWVPFELWRSPGGTPDDPSDDLRLIPWVWGDLTSDGSLDNLIFDLSQYGSSADGSCHDGCEHSASLGDDDPYTDWVYWRIPSDTTPGQAGYLEFENAMKTDPLNWTGDELPVIDRMVLINQDGGVTPPFNQDLPEQGTVFRLKTLSPQPGLAFTFRAEQTPVGTTGPLGLSIFLKYRLINKGSKTIQGCMASLWADPDLGSAGDDLIGCDSATQRVFCYNGWTPDSHYGIAPPAMGFKVLEGPVVPSPGDTAHIEGHLLEHYRNTVMYSASRLLFDIDPDSYSQSYCLMNGLDHRNHCIPFIDPTTSQPTRYTYSGDPVAGTGWLDNAPDEREMIATVGPFDFRPGDTQQVIFKFAVGQGTDRISSLSSLYDILEYDSSATDVDDRPESELPRSFVVHPNYPNPFNPVTTIRYALPARAEVEIAVFNVLGQRVTTLVDRYQEAGEHTAVWSGTDASGRSVASGIYFYRVKAGNNVQTRKMMLLK